MDVGIHLSVEIKKMDAGAHIEFAFSVSSLVRLEVHKLLKVCAEAVFEKRLLHLFAIQKVVVSSEKLGD